MYEKAHQTRPAYQILRGLPLLPLTCYHYPALEGPARIPVCWQLA